MMHRFDKHNTQALMIQRSKSIASLQLRVAYSRRTRTRHICKAIAPYTDQKSCITHVTVRSSRGHSLAAWTIAVVPASKTRGTGVG